MRVVFCSFFVFVSFLGNWVYAQSSIDLGVSRVPLNQTYVLTLRSSQSIQSHDAFPDLLGFTKRSRSSSSSTTISNGRITSEHKILQYYAPQKQGTFAQSGFSMRINGQLVSVPAFEIQVIEATPVQNKPVWSRDPFSWHQAAPQTFVDVKDEAFLAFSPDKKEMFLGEGVHVVLEFYVAETNQAPLQFYQLSSQLTSLLKKIKPQTCWEENFNIQEVEKESVLLSGKRYARYKLFEATYYPLRNQDMYFPSVGLKMLKYKVAQQPSFFGSNRQEDFKTFYTSPRTVRVKPLPPHPLRDVVAVGNYALSEEISSTDVQTGEGFSYTYIISGKGNLSAIQAPRQQANTPLTLYPPQVKQQINRGSGAVYGAKRFMYYGNAEQAGTYALKDHLEWIFFNPKEAVYDTLSPTVVLIASGQNIGNQQIATQEVSNFYALLDQASQVSVLDKALSLRWWWGAVLALGGISVFGWVWHKKS